MKWILDEAGRVDFEPFVEANENAVDVFAVEVPIERFSRFQVEHGAILRPHCPISWFHDRGRYRVLERLIPRLPDVGGGLFLTLTVDPKLFDFDELKAHSTARPKIRKVLDRLRQGVRWEGKEGRIKAEHCTKVEFHENGFAHYHLIFLTRRFLPKELLEKLWGFGFVKVQRITNEDFHYLLKYVTKDNGPLPEWVLGLKRMRIFQASPGFYRAKMEEPDPENDTGDIEKKERAASEQTTIGERLHKWACTVIYREGAHFSTLILSAPFQEIFEAIIYPIALEGRYLGQNVISITEPEQLYPWLNYTKTAA